RESFRNTGEQQWSGHQWPQEAVIVPEGIVQWPQPDRGMGLTMATALDSRGKDDQGPAGDGS
ncbi:UNVERIFIED_CONTAM: hypothetical protein K2H54_055260, partial [Gekko kuhli]